MAAVTPGRLGRLGLAALALLALARPGDAAAQERRTPPTARLGEHRFMESDLIPLPMATTNLLTSLGAGGAGDVEVEVFENTASISPRTIEGSLAYLTLRLGYQQAINDWLAPWFNLGISGRLGTNSVSLLSEGVAYQSSWELGWMIRVREWERSRLAATVNLWNSSWGFVELDEWLRDVIASGGIQEGNELYHEAPSLTGGGGLRYAHAFNAVFGLAAMAEGGVGEEPNATAETASFFRAGLLADMDLDAMRRVPLGLALGYRYETRPGAEPDSRLESHQGIVRLEYTGREEYAVALETQMGSLPLTSGDSAFITQVKLVTRYYF